MNPLEKIINIEVTVDQACGILAALVLARASCQQWLDEHPDSKDRAYTETELEKIEGTGANIEAAVKAAMVEK